MPDPKATEYDLSNALRQFGLLGENQSVNNTEQAFQEIQRNCPNRALKFFVDGFDNISDYMIIFRELAKLALMEDKIKRVMATRNSPGSTTVSLSFYYDNQKFEWKFEVVSKWLSDDFFRKSINFYEAESQQIFLRISKKDEALLTIISMPGEIVRAMEALGWRLDRL